MNVQLGWMRCWKIRHNIFTETSACVTLIFHRVKRIMQHYWEFRQHTPCMPFIHTCKSQHIVFRRHSEGNFHFQPAKSSSGLFLCLCACVGVSPSVSQRLLAGTEYDELICYTANVRRSLEHLVTLLSREILSLRSLAATLRAAAVPDNESVRQFQPAEINKLMLRLSLNKEWTFVRALRAKRGKRKVMKDVIREGRRTNRGGLLVTSQTVFTERLI